MYDSLKCPECHKVINRVDTSQKCSNCPFCQLRILVAQIEQGQHLSFHECDLNEVVAKRPTAPVHDKHCKLKLHKDWGAITEA